MGETRNVLGVIYFSYGKFFEAEKKIADYTMEHKAEVVDMTVRELAKASDTSDATVSRSCRRCRSKGFHSLGPALAREVLEEERRDINVSNEIDRDKLSQSLQNILTNKVAEPTETMNMTDVTQLEQIFDKLEHARMVQLAAAGNTAPVVLDGALKLNRLGIAAVAGGIWEAQAIYAFNLGPRNVVLVTSNSGSSERLQALTEGVKEDGCTLIFITNNNSSPLVEIRDHKIVTVTREKPLAEEFWFSKVTAAAVMKTLYPLLLLSKKDAAEHIQRHERVISPGK